MGANSSISTAKDPPQSSPVATSTLPKQHSTYQTIAHQPTPNQAITNRTTPYQASVLKNPCQNCCQRRGFLPCQICRMVEYCCAPCMEEHAKEHELYIYFADVMNHREITVSQPKIDKAKLFSIRNPQDKSWPFPDLYEKTCEMLEELKRNLSEKNFGAKVQVLLFITTYNAMVDYLEHTHNGIVFPYLFQRMQYSDDFQETKIFGPFRNTMTSIVGSRNNSILSALFRRADSNT